MCPSVLTQAEETGHKICVGLCVAFDPKVTDGARHSLGARKVFTQEALHTGFVLPSRSTKRRSRYPSLRILTRIDRISPIFLSIQIVSYASYNKPPPPPRFIHKTHTWCFHWDKCPSRSEAEKYTRPPTHTSSHTRCSSAVASCPQRGCWQMWR